jgi:hypothetical protein
MSTDREGEGLGALGDDNQDDYEEEAAHDLQAQAGKFELVNI